MLVFHIRLGNKHRFGSFLGIAHAVPYAVDVSAVELHLLVVPVDRLCDKLNAEPLTRFFCNVDVKADNLTRLGILKAHRREFRIKPKDKPSGILYLRPGLVLFRGGCSAFRACTAVLGRRTAFPGAGTARGNNRHHCCGKQNRNYFLHKISSEFIFCRACCGPADKQNFIILIK